MGAFHFYTETRPEIDHMPFVGVMLKIMLTNAHQTKNYEIIWRRKKKSKKSGRTSGTSEMESVMPRQLVLSKCH